MPQRERRRREEPGDASVRVSEVLTELSRRDAGGWIFAILVLAQTVSMQRVALGLTRKKSNQRRAK